MTSKKELQVAYTLAVVLLVIGFFCYVAYSAKVPDQPVRKMFKCPGGKVLFDHKTHGSDKGYGLACGDCHHHFEEDESAIRSCGDCHLHQDKTETDAASCTECHEKDEIEDAEVPVRTDAFHDQCKGCHEEIEKGPVECSACHIL